MATSVRAVYFSHVLQWISHAGCFKALRAFIHGETGSSLFFLRLDVSLRMGSQHTLILVLTLWLPMWHTYPAKGSPKLSTESRCPACIPADIHPPAKQPIRPCGAPSLKGKDKKSIAPLYAGTHPPAKQPIRPCGAPSLKGKDKKSTTPLYAGTHPPAKQPIRPCGAPPWEGRTKSRQPRCTRVLIHPQSNPSAPAGHLP